MKPKFLLAAASAAPILLMMAGVARATDTISSSTTTAVATATATNGAPDNVDVASGGTVAPTASGAAVTLNSNNVVTNEGSINFSTVNNAVGILVFGGNTGSVTNTSSILVTDNYTPSVDNNTGLDLLPFAQGTGREGIQVIGPGTFTGSLFNYGTVTVHGDSSFGVDIEAPITGDYRSLEFTAATSSAAAYVTSGTITVLGGEPALNGAAATNPTYGFHIGPSGAVGGNVTLGYVSATGSGARAVDIEGSVAGALSFTGSVSSTGYRSTARSSYPTVAAQYTALELGQGDSAVVIGANVGGGVVLAAPPLTAITNASTSSDVINGISVLQTVEPTGSIATYGSAPALVIGSPTNTVALGVISNANNTSQGADANGTYGLAINGTVTGNGVFDQLNYPNLPAPVSGNALQIGSTGGFAAIVNGGVYNSGQIDAQSYQANATAIHFTAGGATPTIVNDGLVLASSIQENTATTVSVNTSAGAQTINVVPANVYGILIDPGATVTSIVNNAGITANITGSAGVGGTVGAIIDRSGTLTSVLNTGSISAQATQTLVTSPMPVTLTAIDMSAGTGPQSITQSLSQNSTITGAAAYNNTVAYNQGQVVAYNGIVYQATTAAAISIDPLDYPSYWRQIGATTPFIGGSVLFGSGGSALTVNAGTVDGAYINLGTGANNVLTINSPSNGSTLGATNVIGAIEEATAATAAAQVTSGGAPVGGGNGTLTINVNSGTLKDLNPNTEYVRSVNVGATGLLVVSADPSKGVNTKFVTTGASTFAQGAQVGISLLSIPAPLTTYVILQTVPGQGTLTAGTLGAGVIGSAPWLYTASAATVLSADPSTSPSEVTVTVAQKTDAQLGFNAAEGAALNAVLAAAPATASIQSALLSQTTEAGLKGVYDQLLPSQGQGLFDALDAAAQAVSGMTGTTPEAGSRVAGTSLWLQEVNERVDRSGIQTIGSNSKLFGIIAGYEYSGVGGGAAGLTLGYYNTSEQNDADPISTGESGSLVEAGAYYRRTAGKFTVSARVGLGYAWLSDHRIFATIGTTSATDANSATGVELAAQSNWGAIFYDGHVGGAFEQPFGHYYARPEVSADFFELDEGSHTDTGGGNAFDLTVASRRSSRLSGQALLVLGRQWGQSSWLRTEVRGGYREILAGQIGDTVANFSGGNPFSLAPDSDRGGWFTAGFSVKAGSQYSYLALEGDLDYRAGERRYDLRIAGRSVF